jgi:predicted dinucleotide-binding enzyme
LKGKVVLDATNPIDDKKAPQRGVLQFFTGPNESLMERLQSIAKDAKFVKCWSCVGNAMVRNTKPVICDFVVVISLLPFVHMQMVNPQYENGRKPTMFICGNDSGAKQLTIQILNQFGWRSADMGFVESARASMRRAVCATVCFCALIVCILCSLQLNHSVSSGLSMVSSSTRGLTRST